MDLRLVRDGGTLTLIRRRGWGWGLLLSIAGIGFLLTGVLFAINGEHFPHMSTLATALWAGGMGLVCSLLGIGLTRNGEWFFFTGQGMQVRFFRWRVIRWSIDYHIKWINDITVQLQPGPFPLYRVFVNIKKRAPVLIASDLRMEEAWELASAMSEPARIPIEQG